MTTTELRASTTAFDASATRGPRRLGRGRRRVGVPALLLTVTTLFGVAVGRFVLYEAHHVAIPAAPAAPTTEQTVARLEAAVRRDPGDTASLVALGRAYLRRAIETADPSYYSLSSRALDRVDAITPGSNDALLTRGALELSLHQFANARAVATQVNAREPAQPDALAIMVDASVELGDYDGAATLLQELLDHRPGLAAYSRASYLRELHGDYAGAEVAMRQAAVAGSGSGFDNATITTFLGDLEFAQGHVAAAAAEYDRALKPRVHPPLAELGRAKTLAAFGRTNDAILVLQRLTNRYPLPAAVALLGDLQARAGRTADAARSYELVRAITKLQQAAGQVTDLELAVFEADHAADPAAAAAAVDLARRAYDARPGNVFAADALAWALVNSGDAAAARPLINQSRRLGTPDALLHYHAAVVLDATGESSAARDELTRAFKTNPWFSFLHRDPATALAAKLGVAVPAAWSAS